jgi:hypothetical protein
VMQVLQPCTRSQWAARLIVAADTSPREAAIRPA